MEGAAQQIPQQSSTVRVAAVGDVHCTTRSQGALAPIFQAVNELADVLVLCGDLADYGLAEEAQILVRELSVVRVPIVAVLGNHDFESEQQDAVKQILCEGGIQVLDGDACEIKGVGFAGIKGFGGGFGSRTLGSWGEPAIKAFVQEALQEALKLESALARLRTEQKIVLMHYSPIQATCEGEPLEIMPFLGSSRLEEPINRYPVTAVLHGHAHHGSLEGHTQAEIPVYNVSAPLLRAHFPDRPPFRIFELPTRGPAQTEAPPTEGRSHNGLAGPNGQQPHAEQPSGQQPSGQQPSGQQAAVQRVGLNARQEAQHATPV
ncbi:MAG: metallophosphoesterase [Chloroflexi bacterium]|nr:metallophosphoesterase [Chloroflexota bacterium]